MQKRLFAASAAVLVSLSLGLAGCSSDSGSTAAVQDPGTSAQAPASPERVDAAVFSEVVARPGVTIIDVRSPEEFAAGHIEGALNYNVQGPDFMSQVSSLDPAGTYAVYCQSGNRSQVAVAAMSEAGVNGIYELESGISGWQGAGQRVVQ